MINKQFIEDTDKLIEKIKSRGISVHHGNMIVAKVKSEEVTEGGILLPKSARDQKDYHNGLARVIAVADQDYANLIGNYILHPHEARLKLHEDALREILNDYVEKDLVYAIQDNNVIMSVKGESI
jgi:hypothetical protein